jgi:hypothetical protein
MLIFYQIKKNKKMNEKVAPTARQIHIPLSALHAVSATKAYFNEEAQTHNVGEQELLGVEIAKHEQTPEGFVELGWDHLEAQKSLHLDLHVLCSGPIDTWPELMQGRAKQAFEEFNQKREEKIDIDTVDSTFLFRISEPRWIDELTDDSREQWPEELQPDLEMLKEVDDKLKVLSQDEGLRKEAQEIWGDRVEIMKQAAQITGRKRKIDVISRRVSGIRTGAARSGQQLSKGKMRQIGVLESQMSQLQDDLYSNTVPVQLLGELSEEIERRDRKGLRKQLENGLVLTESMTRIMDEALPSITKGNPALFVGETGGAKTALAKYLSRVGVGREPEIVSGYADVNGYQLMGKTGLSSENGVTVSEFVEGPVVRAMEEGRPLILDEINAMPPEFLKRLNEILQLRPGDTMTIQEDSGRQITVAHGFCILATANEKSHRYQGVHDLSTEFRNRFTANTYRVAYPDAEVVAGQDPVDNYKIAYAASVDKTGSILLAEGAEKLEDLAKAAHVIQRLFTGHINDGLQQEELDILGSERLADGNATGLDENVLAPRTMVALIEKTIDSQGELSLADVLGRWVSSIKNPHDKKVISTVLKTRNLIIKN